MMRPRSALFFAAGFGTRMAPLTDTRPKPLIEVAGKPLLFHALDLGNGLTRVVNVHYLGEQIIDCVPDDVLISDERGAILETGGGLKKALPLLGDDPVFTMNTDAVWRGPNPFDALAARWTDDMDGLLLLVAKENASGHVGKGDFLIDMDGRITRGAGDIYTGCQIIRTSDLAACHDSAFSMWELWNRMLDRRKLFGMRYDGKWCDVGRPDCISIAEDMLRDNVQSN